MSFLLDTDICSAYLKNQPKVVSKVLLHYGGLQVSAISVGELYTWAKRRNAPVRREHSVRDFLAACEVLPVSESIGELFGGLRAGLLDNGISVGESDLFIAATAIHHNLVLVTHNVADYTSVPGLRVVDWTQ